MKKPDSPCYNCQDRTSGCHGSCGKYAEYKNAVSDYSYAIVINRHKNRPSDVTYRQFEGITKQLHHRDRMSGKGKCTQ